MDYEKAYKEALERAKTYHTNKSGASLVEYIFPELKESEDEKIINRIKSAVEAYWSDEPLDEILRWLEKQKPEWSEEDKEMLSACIRIFERIGDGDLIKGNKDDANKYISFLKFLRPQKHWKPSEEHLKALMDSIQGLYACKYKNLLFDIYEQLKAL